MWLTASKLLLLLLLLLPLSLCLGDVVPRALSLAARAHDSSLLWATQQLAGPMPDMMFPRATSRPSSACASSERTGVTGVVDAESTDGDALPGSTGWLARGEASPIRRTMFQRWIREENGHSLVLGSRALQHFVTDHREYVHKWPTTLDTCPMDDVLE